MKKILILFSILIVSLSGCVPNSPEQTSKDFEYFFFDTPISIKILYTEAENYDFEKIDKDMQTLIKDIETKYSWQKDGMMRQVNTGKPTEVDDTFLKLYDVGNEYCQKTNGSYNPLSGELTKLWSIGDKNYFPTEEEINAVIKPLDCNRLAIDGKQVTIPPNTMLDFGSLNKGYASQKVSEYLKSQNIKSAIINMGGNVQLVGKKYDETDYIVGIRNPELNNLDGDSILTVPVSDSAVVTSGLYERYFEKDGKIYHHILDAKTGYPTDNSLVSVTIITPDGLNADLLSTNCFILGLEEATKLINSMPDTEAIFVTKDKKIYMTDANQKYELKNSDYEIQK